MNEPYPNYERDLSRYGHVASWNVPEYLRSQLDAECISMGELIELQNLAEHIQPGDVQLAEAAGIDEQEFAKR